MNIEQSSGSNIDYGNINTNDPASKILFLDTFSSANLDNDFEDINNKKEPNVGLVQFICPVIIHEIRIIPLSTLVSAESLRRVHLGATIPSSFDIHFYVNELTAKESSTFLDIGCFSYKEHENHIFKPNVSVATDGLFLRGHFESVTLVVLGEVTNLSSLITKESTASRISNDINIDNDEDSRASYFDGCIVDIKEPDDTQDYIETEVGKLIGDSLPPNKDDSVSLTTSAKSQHPVQDVHSLSPSPENVARILSPSPSRHHYGTHNRDLSATPPQSLSFKSHSNSSRENQLRITIGKKSLSHKDYVDDEDDDDDVHSDDRKKYRPPSSKSSASSISPSSNSYSLKSRIAYSSSSIANKNSYSKSGSISNRRYRSSVERERSDELNSTPSSSHHRHHHHHYRNERYNNSPSTYGKYYSSQRDFHQHSKRSREHSPSATNALSSRPSKYRSSVNKYAHDSYRSRSNSKDVDSDHEHQQHRLSPYGTNINHSRSNLNRHHEIDNYYTDDYRRHRQQPRHRSISLEKQDRGNNLNSRSNLHRNRGNSRDMDKCSHTIDSCLTRTRNNVSGSYKDSYSDNNSRDLISPKSSSNKYRSYHHLSDRVRSRSKDRSRSLSPLTVSSSKRNKRDHSEHLGKSSHYRRDSNSCDRNDSIDSPDLKKSRYSTPRSVNIASPSCDSGSSPISVASQHNEGTHYNNDNDQDNRPTSSKADIESIASPVSPTDDDSTMNLIGLKDSQTSPSPLANISPHSSISNISLDQLDCDSKTTNPEISNDNIGNDVDKDSEIGLKNVDGDKEICKNENNCDDKSNVLKNDVSKELFEPLSGSDMDDDFDDNFEQISTSSDVDADNLEDDQNGEKTCNAKAELEIISSDEEYDTDLNAALASEKVEYAKNYLDTTGVGSKYDDDIDNELDLNKNLFDPLAANQLSVLKFPFNTNKMTTYIDLKLFRSIIEFMHENFSILYSSHEEQNRRILIQEEWVINVEKLATDIMKLTCPIYYSFNEDLENVSGTSEQDFENLIPILISIAKDGLDFDLALAQKNTYRVRHIKAGIKLLIALFSSFDIRSSSSITENDNAILFKRLLEENLPYHLLKLYEKPFMTLPLRLLILNGLIVICDHAEGVDYLCHRKFQWTNDLDQNVNDENNDQKMPSIDVLNLKDATCYQYILSLIIKRQNSRLPSVFEELLNKIHLYELFETFSVFSENVLDINEGGNHSWCNMTTDKIDLLPAMLSRMINYFEIISNRIHRPLRFLPYICQYEIKTTVNASIPLLLLSTSNSRPPDVPNTDQFDYIHDRFQCKQTYCSSSKIGFNAQKSFYRFFKHFNLFDSLIRLLKFLKTTDHTCNAHQKFICDKILTLLDIITSHQQGLKFLLEDSSNIHKVNAIHSILTDFASTHNQCSQRFVDFGIKFITSDVIDSLLRLFMMIHFKKAMFRDIVVSILTLEHNFDAVHSFIIPITSQFDPNSPHFLNEKKLNLDSTSFIYATRIAIACVQYLPEKNLLHFYETYGKSLLKNSENVQNYVQNSLIKLHRSDIFQSHVLKYSMLMNWISPLKNDNFNSHDELTLRKFVTILKKHHDVFQEKIQTIENFYDRVFFIEPELVTAIKILVALCDPNANHMKNNDPDMQLKYKHALVSCYCFDCTTYLMTLLEAVVETCERPSHRTFANTFSDSYINLFVKNLKINQSNQPSHHQQHKTHSLQQFNNSILNQGSLVIEFIRPSVRFLQLILNYLTQSYGHNFNDSTPIPVLLKLYNILSYFSSYTNDIKLESNTKQSAQFIQQQIIDIIISVYTAVHLEHSESEESLRKSVWTKMLKHVFEFISLAPKYFVSGLEILSKILPTPLPLMMNKTLNDGDISFIINYRKLWSAHLHCLNDDLENMFNYLILSNCLPLQKLLRVVCYKMCDLSAPTVLTISKTITEFLVHTLCDIIESKSQSPIDESLIKYHSDNCGKIIDFILDLFSSSLSFRIGILNAFCCFATSSDVAHRDSKFLKLFHRMFFYLNRKKFVRNFTISSKVFVTEILSDTESPNDDDFLSLFRYFFDTEDNTILTLKTFKFSDKLSSKFFMACSQSLNKYFADRKVYVIDNRQSDNLEVIDISKKGPTNEEDEMVDGCKSVPLNNEIIYGHQFSQLSVDCRMPEQWQSLIENQTNHLSIAESGMRKIDFLVLAKKYLKLDCDGLLKILNNYHSPIVELPEAPEKSSEDSVTKLIAINPQPKRTTIRGRVRQYGHRGDPFRSRPPNTSRPPSMHVDDFVAMEQRSDPLVISNKNRSNHLISHHNSNVLPAHSSNSSTISYCGKHSDYVRKKNFNSHSSSPYHANYSNSIKMNNNNNNNNN
ncbi:hypothetical protein DERP_007575 [Dermatophagoides pteronyssinus]|uniref:Virilizer N-terminal domain-containing protein n=1 Tax=Dermatophagoides pteronyssinus TaxID=6956 RepID=A0ABQ8JK99_DERPT|nr:hypothetical protein DERP_007575 [Dermatophagoides pteronyssinus]